MNFRRNPRFDVEDKIDITPLVDVVFLLLIFLLISTTFRKKEHVFVIKMPKVAAKRTEVVTTDQTTIMVNKDGRYVFVQKGAETPKEELDKGIPLTELKKRLASFAAVEQKKKVDEREIILIRADKAVKYQHVVDILGILNELSLGRFRLSYEKIQTIKAPGPAPSK